MTKGAYSAGGAVRRVALAVALAASALGGGCAAFVPASGVPTSLGTVNDGALREASSFPRTAVGLERARPEDPTAFGTPNLVAAVLRAAEAVNRGFAGSAPLRLGDASSPSGGAHPRHRSHRAGRDLDVLFFSVDGTGAPIRGSGFIAFDRFGVGIHRGPAPTANVAESADADAGAEPPGPVFFDDARNWHFVRELLRDPDIDLQWIFCSDGIKARLLRYAATHEPDSELVFRAAWVLHQPSNGRAHDDHFHIRVTCARDDLARGCVDTEPFWSWLPDMGKGPEGEFAVTDALLYAAVAETNPDVPVEPAAGPAPTATTKQGTP